MNNHDYYFGHNCAALSSLLLHVLTHPTVICPSEVVVASRKRFADQDKCFYVRADSHRPSTRIVRRQWLLAERTVHVEMSSEEGGGVHETGSVRCSEVRTEVTAGGGWLRAAAGRTDAEICSSSVNGLVELESD